MPDQITRTRDRSQALMYRIGQRRRYLRMPRRVVVTRLGVGLSTVIRWDYGKSSPRYRFAVAYAEHVGLRVVLHDGFRILAEGMAIPAALPCLRKAAGLTQRDLARILHVQKPAVAMFETRGCTVELATVEAYAAGLGLVVGLVEAATDTAVEGIDSRAVAS